MITNVKQNYTSPVFSIFSYFLYYNSWKPLHDFKNKNHMDGFTNFTSQPCIYFMH